MRKDKHYGQTPDFDPSPTYQARGQSPLQPSYQGQQQHQNHQARAQRDTKGQLPSQEPYHPPYERQVLVQQVRQQQSQSPQNHLQQPQQREAQQQYNNQGRQQNILEYTQRSLTQQDGVQYQQFEKQSLGQQGGVQYQQYGQQSSAQPGGVQYQQYGQQARPMQQDPLQEDSYSNPRTVFFHVLFKGTAIIFYMFGGWLTSSFVVQFVVIVLLVAFDFWTVKNVSGRILVGLRYWNESDANGNSIWRFESLDRHILARLNKKDTLLFWTSLYVTPAIWTLFGIVAALKLNFDYLMVTIIALTMCVSNIIGFTKCHKDSKKKAQTFAQQAMGGFMREAMTAGITNNISKVLNIF